MLKLIIMDISLKQKHDDMVARYVQEQKDIICEYEVENDILKKKMEEELRKKDVKNFNINQYRFLK